MDFIAEEGELCINDQTNYCSPIILFYFLYFQGHWHRHRHLQQKNTQNLQIKQKSA